MPVGSGSLRWSSSPTAESASSVLFQAICPSCRTLPCAGVPGLTDKNLVGRSEPPSSWSPAEWSGGFTRMPGTNSLCSADRTPAPVSSHITWHEFTGNQSLRQYLCAVVSGAPSPRLRLRTRPRPRAVQLTHGRLVPRNGCFHCGPAPLIPTHGQATAQSDSLAGRRRAGHGRCRAYGIGRATP